MIKKTVIVSLALCTFFVLNGCFSKSSGPDDDFDLEPFKKLAGEAECAQIKNRLYWIDKSLVFWDREGECPDNWYAQTLYGKSVDDIKCQYHDSVGGPVYVCNDSTYHEMFQTILGNVDSNNLGLHTSHTVEGITF